MEVAEKVSVLASLLKLQRHRGAAKRELTMSLSSVRTDGFIDKLAHEPGVRKVQKTCKTVLVCVVQLYSVLVQVRSLVPRF